MRAVVLAAGQGTRMLPLTKEIPKVLVEVNGKPFLYYLLKSLEKAKYKQICLVVGFKKEKILDFIEKYNFKVAVVEQEKQKGTGDAVLQAEEFVGKKDFVVLGGDNLWSVSDLKSIGKKDSFNYVCGVEVNNPEKYGVLRTNGRLLKEIIEKPQKFIGNLINTALYKFKSEIFPLLDKLKESPRGEIELTDAVSILAKKEKVKIIRANQWIDFGCPEDISKVELFLKKNWEE